MTNDIHIPWPKRESWTVAEAACLFARIDPPITSRSAFEGESAVNADLALMYREIKDGTMTGTLPHVNPGGWFGNRRLIPRICLAWAVAKGIGAPELLREMEAGLPVPVGFEIEDEMYAAELDAALITYRAVTKRIKEGHSGDRQPKELIREWLVDHHQDLPQSARDRIATVCNWHRSGGRPKSP